MAVMRNKLIHGYDTVDASVLWAARGNPTIKTLDNTKWFN
jgi:uncharacterized protein with HEPN domain